MRGVTHHVAVGCQPGAISTRTPHAGSDVEPEVERLEARISTRTPHAGSDRRRGVALERATISTRTPHAGSDPG